jgi:hypothetical protein
VRRSFKVITQPAIEPITLAEVKLFAKIDNNDEDPLLQNLISAARETAEKFTRKSFITQTIRLTLDMAYSDLERGLGQGVYDLPASALYGSLPSVIELPCYPVQSITSVTTYNTANTGTVYSSDNYRLNSDGNRMVLNQNAVWPGDLRPIGAVEIVYVAGYGDTGKSLPQSIKTAMLMHIQTMYDGCPADDMPDPSIRLLKQHRVMDGLAYG